MPGKRKKITWVVTDTGCWDCTSHALNIHGYPHIWKNGRGQNGSRIVYEETYGPIPKGLVVRHKCDNRKCINPDHLELGTHKQNMEDCVARGRKNTRRGEGRKDTKLTDSEVKEIRASTGVPQSQLAKKYNVTQSTISRIKNRKKRQYVPE